MRLWSILLPLFRRQEPPRVVPVSHSPTLDEVFVPDTNTVVPAPPRRFSPISMRGAGRGLGSAPTLPD